MAALIILFEMPFMAARVNADPNPGVGDFVNRLYGYALGRTPDPEGFNDWCYKLQCGETNGADVARGIIFSQEALNLNLDDSCFVDMLYHVFFNRAPDETGMQVWVS